MQQKFAHPKYLLETSILMVNTDRIGEETWSMGVCQNVLRQTQVFYLDLLNSTSMYYGDGKQEQPDVELMVLFLRETLNPFMVKWESVFFCRDQSPRRRASRKNRYNMQCDFLTLAEVTTDLIEEIKEAESSKEDKPKNNPRGMN